MEKSISKKYKLIVFIAIVLVLIYGVYSIMSVSYIPAQLYLESGTVLVNNKQVHKSITLSENDIVETKEGTATVFIYESIVILVEPNTKISISDLTKSHPRINQQQGTTWSQFTKLAGVEDYTVTEGNNRASVRGTGFELSENKVMTGLGVVDYSFNSNQFSVYENRVIDNGAERATTPLERARIENNLKLAIKQLQQIRQKEIDMHPILVGILTKTIIGKIIERNEKGEIVSERTASKREIEEYISRADKGEYNVDEITAKIPIKVGFVQKVADLTKEIQRLQKIIA